MTAREKFHKGQILKPSEYGIKSNIFNGRVNTPDTRWVVVGFSLANQMCVNVARLEGRACWRSLHINFLEPDPELAPYAVTTSSEQP